MKKTLLATAMLAMAFGAANAGTIKVTHNGEDVEPGSTIEVNIMEISRDAGEYDGLQYVSDMYEMNAHVAFVNTSANAIGLGGKRTVVKENTISGMNASWCIGQNCVAADAIPPQQMGPNETFDGLKSHVYLQGTSYVEDGELVFGEVPTYGEAEYQYTLYVEGNEADNFVFNIHFVYNEESPVYINGELGGVETVATENSKPVYYNLQGVQISNPVKGQIYIVKQGSKVSKQIAR